MLITALTSLEASRELCTPISETDRQEVQQELERILASAPFRTSRRYPAFLRYVVEKALAGEADDLKERILGIEVFHRPPDYDTHSDPVVRFSAGEVRRRIANYYSESRDRGSFEISLPIGSYVPHFSRVTSVDSQNLFAGEAEVGQQASAAELVPDNPAVLPSVWDQIPTTRAPRSSNLSGALLGLFIGVIGCVACLFAASAVKAKRQANAPIMQLWQPLLSHPNAVLISAGRTHPQEDLEPERPGATIEEHILRPEARISFPTVQAISQVAGFLEAEHKQFRIHEAYSNNLEDMRRLPIVFIAAYNNVWTLRLLEPLRFHFGQQGALHYIEDAREPGKHKWAVDFANPYMQQTVDYAIIGRFFDQTTNGPVVVIAGISSSGTDAAAEFMVSPDALDKLARLAPGGSLHQDFEAVLRVEVVGGSPGAASVVATQFW